MPKWSKKLPTKSGIYLRNNPSCSHVVRQDIFEIDGELCTSSGSEQTFSATRLSKWHGAKIMWWYGPIPSPPTTAQEQRDG